MLVVERGKLGVGEYFGTNDKEGGLFFQTLKRKLLFFMHHWQTFLMNVTKET